MDAHGILIRAATRANYKQAFALIDNLPAESLLADRGYDTNAIVTAAMQLDM